MRPLDIRHITVRRGALDLEVAVSLDTLRVDERVAARMLDELPNLARHVCVSDSGEFFGDEIVGTELAHLLEHVIIELQGHGAGHTSWEAELAETRGRGHALMRVTVTYRDDFEALRAVEAARTLVERVVLDEGGSAR